MHEIEPNVRVRNKVTMIGNTDLVSGAAQIASQMYATNMLHLILHMCENPKKPRKVNFKWTLAISSFAR